MSAPATTRRALHALGLVLDEDVSSWSKRDGGMATIDALGRNSFGGECRGHVVFDYTASRSEFWQMVLDEAREIAPTLCPCPHPIGECEFHDAEGGAA